MSSHEEEIHLPAPSIWPFVAAVGITLLPIGALMLVHPDMLPTGLRAAHGTIGFIHLGVGAAIALVGAFGWMTTVIREKTEIDTVWGNNVLSMAWKLFLLSEAAIFGAFFGHYFHTLYSVGLDNWPPAGSPHIHLLLPAMGSGILVLSSVTCEFAHKSLIGGHRSLCKNWLLVTMGLGIFFLTIQGYEWGVLLYKDAFNPTTNMLGTTFYLVTGFHGFHVVTGLLLLFLVYARVELGDMSRKRHFSLNAASWYWHFVDVIWLIVFFCIYVLAQGQ